VQYLDDLHVPLRVLEFMSLHLYLVAKLFGRNNEYGNAMHLIADAYDAHY
jgi:hypothetical protein